MFHVGYIISLTHLHFIVSLSLYVCTDVLIYSSSQLQECLIKLLTYLLKSETISGLNVTFDLLTSKSNQFIFVPNCSSVINLVKLTQAVCSTSLNAGNGITFYMSEIMYQKSRRFRGQTVNRYASAGKVSFRKMLSETLIL